MENALSDQEYGVGEEMLRDAMERLASQKTDVSGALTDTPEPSEPSGAGVFPSPQSPDVFTPERAEAVADVFRGELPPDDSTKGVPGEKEPVFGEAPLDQPDFARIEQSLGKENAQMEQKAWQVINGTWRFFPKPLQDAIRAKQQQGVSFTEIMQFDEVDQFLQGLLK